MPAQNDKARLQVYRTYLNFKQALFVTRHRQVGQGTWMEVCAKNKAIQLEEAIAELEQGLISIAMPDYLWKQITDCYEK